VYIRLPPLGGSSAAGQSNAERREEYRLEIVGNMTTYFAVEESGNAMEQERRDAMEDLMRLAVAGAEEGGESGAVLCVF
jgi:hypothetical protein